MEHEAFARGLARLQACTGHRCSDVDVETFFEVLGPRLSDEQWLEFVAGYVLTPIRNASGRPVFPMPAEVLDRALWSELPAEAEMAYQATLAAGSYTPEGGMTWTYSGVRNACGIAAADAWLAAGGHEAFATTFREDARRAAFIREYQAAARDTPSHRYLGPAAQAEKRLANGDPSREQAVALVAQIRRRMA